MCGQKIDNCITDIRLCRRYVSIVMTGVETVLSLCEVEVFSSTSMAVSSCSQRLPPDQVSAFRDTCYHFVPGEVAGYDNAAAREEFSHSCSTIKVEKSTKFDKFSRVSNSECVNLDIIR